MRIFTRTRLMVVVVAAVAFSAGAAAQAAGSWHVFATGTDSGDYGAYASAHADVLHSQALAVRASKTSKLSWTLICSSPNKTVPANTVYSVTVGNAKSCSLSGNAVTESSGKVSVQLLRR